MSLSTERGPPNLKKDTTISAVGTCKWLYSKVLQDPTKLSHEVEQSE